MERLLGLALALLALLTVAGCSGGPLPIQATAEEELVADVVEAWNQALGRQVAEFGDWDQGLAPSRVYFDSDDPCENSTEIVGCSDGRDAWIRARLLGSREDVWRITAHEIGHMLGAEHTPCPSIMCEHLVPGAIGPDAFTEADRAEVLRALTP